MTEMQCAQYGIIVSDQNYRSVWPTSREPPPGWSFTRYVGTQAEMQELVLQEFVPTAPSMHIPRDRRYRDTSFEATYFDDTPRT